MLQFWKIAKSNSSSLSSSLNIIPIRPIPAGLLFFAEVAPTRNKNTFPNEKCSNKNCPKREFPNEKCPEKNSKAMV